MVKSMTYNEVLEDISLSSFIAPMVFKGSYDNFPDMQLMHRGDIVIIDDKTYIYIDENHLEEVAALTETTILESPKVELHRTNCCNCGAPLSGRFCSYCGTLNSIK